MRATNTYIMMTYGLDKVDDCIPFFRQDSQLHLTTGICGAGNWHNHQTPCPLVYQARRAEHMKTLCFHKCQVL